MNLKMATLMASTLLFSACMVATRPGGGIEIIPFLPAIVEVDDDSYYSQDGYHYFYTDDRWYYSNTRDGRRTELPRSHWPRETRRRGRGHSNW